MYFIRNSKFLQYFQKLYGFHGVLEEWQLSRISGIFKRNLFEISATKFRTPSYLSINWEPVASQNMSSGRSWGLYVPHNSFMENIESYRFNKFLDIGKFIFSPYFKLKFLIRIIPTLSMAFQKNLACVEKPASIP